MAKISQPFEGIKVLDFTIAVMGPVVSQFLGDYGADVIKIEPLEGDVARFSTRGGDSSLFLGANRSKRSLAIDLKNPKGIEIVLKLATQADVVIQNFRPGAVDRLGLNYAALFRINPSLIYCSMSMYGETGPMAYRRGADIWGQAFTGVVASQGTPEGPPYLSGVPVVDMGGALIGIAGIITALFVRERTGLGQEITSNQIRAGVFMQMPSFVYHLIDGLPMKKMGRGWRGLFPYGAYTAKDGDVATLFGQDEAEWATVCSILGIEHLLKDARYDTHAKRMEGKSELYPILDQAFRQKTRGEWEELFRQHGLRCDPCLDYAELCAHPQFQANEIITELEHPVRGRIKTVAPPLIFKGMPPAKPQRSPPILGEHTKEILTELGYDSEHVRRLHDEGVIGIPSADMFMPPPPIPEPSPGATAGIPIYKRRRPQG